MNNGFILENSLAGLLFTYFVLNFKRICLSFYKLKSNNFFEVRKTPTSS